MYIALLALEDMSAEWKLLRSQQSWKTRAQIEHLNVWNHHQQHWVNAFCGEADNPGDEARGVLCWDKGEVRTIVRLYFTRVRRGPGARRGPGGEYFESSSRHFLKRWETAINTGEVVISNNY